MDRRNFTKILGISTTGLVLTPQVVLSNNKLITTEEALYLWPFLISFIKGVGAGLVANTIYDYVQDNYLNKEVEDTIRETTDQIRNTDGFPEISRSVVHKTSNNSIFFPLVDNTTYVNGSPNFCAPVINRYGQLVSKLESPAICGLGNMYDSFFANRGGTFNHYEYKKMLMPIRPECICNERKGCEHKGYDNKMSYETLDGDAEIKYWTPPKCSTNERFNNDVVVAVNSNSHRKKFTADFKVEHLT